MASKMSKESDKNSRGSAESSERFPHLLEVPLHSQGSLTLDDIFLNLKAQRQEIESWKSQHKLSFSNQLRPTNNVTIPNDGLPVEDLKLEIERLKHALKRYQQADPKLDFVHKDILETKERALRSLEGEKNEILHERDQILQDLKTVKWHNSNLVSERDRALAEIEGFKKKELELLETLKHRNELCIELRRSRESLENKLAEFTHRHKILDSHLMEIGEQKTSFLEGIYERQSQLEFALAELQDTRESLTLQKAQNSVLLHEKQNIEAYAASLISQLKDAEEDIKKQRAAISALESDLQETKNNLASMTEKYNISSQQVERLSEDCKKNSGLLSNFNVALETVTQNFHDFIHQVEMEESSTASIRTGMTNILQSLEFIEMSEKHKMIDQASCLLQRGSNDIQGSGNVNQLEHSEPNENLLASRSDKMLKDIESLIVEKRNLESSLQEAERNLAQQLDKIEVLLGDTQHLKSTISNLENANRELMDKNKTLIHEEKKLRDMVNNSKDEISSLKTLIENNMREIESTKQDLQNTLQANRIMQSRLHVIEHEIGQRRASVGWTTKIQPKDDIDRLKEGLTVHLVNDKRIQKFFSFNKDNASVQDHFIQLDHAGTTLHIWKTKKAQESGRKPEKSIPLKDILYTEFGYTSTSHLWVQRSKKTILPSQSDNVPMYWRCFVIHTMDQVFDIFCKTDQDLEALVLGVGWNTKDAITIRSRHELLYRRVKIKLQEHCRRRKITLVQLFLEAIRRSLALTPELINKFTPSSKGHLKTKTVTNLLDSNSKKSESKLSLKKLKNSHEPPIGEIQGKVKAKRALLKKSINSPPPP